MAVTYVGASTIGAVAANPPTFNITLPALNADDIIVIKVMSKNIVEATNEINTPSGYTEKGVKTEIDNANAPDDMRTALFYKRAVGGDSGASVTISRAGGSTLGLYGLAHVWRGVVNTGDPFDTAGIVINGNNTVGDIIAFSAFDPVATDVHVIYDGWYADDVISPALANFTNDSTTFTIRNAQETATGSDATSGVWSADRNGNNLGAINVTCAGNDGTSIGYTYALLPAATGTTLTPGTGALDLAGFAPTLGLPRTLTPGVGALTLTGFAPTVGLPRTLTPGVGQLVLEGFAPTIDQIRTLTPGTGQLVLDGFAPTVGLPRTITPGVGQLVLDGFAPTIGLPVTITPGVGALVLEGFAPSISTGGTTITPGTGELVLEGFAPTIEVGTAPARRGKGGFRRVLKYEEREDAPKLGLVAEPPLPVVEAAPLPDAPAAPPPRHPRATPAPVVVPERATEKHRAALRESAALEEEEELFLLHILSALGEI